MQPLSVAQRQEVGEVASGPAAQKPGPLPSADPQKWPVHVWLFSKDNSSEIRVWLTLSQGTWQSLKSL